MSLTSLSSLSDEENTLTRRKERFYPFEEYDETQFRMKFRVSKETVLFLESVFGQNVKPLTKRNRPIQPIDQILITLRYYATGGYQKLVGDLFNLKQPTVNRIVHRITAEIAKLKPTYIYMPTPLEQLDIANDFCAIANFPKVLGAVGCTHVKISSPGGQQAKTFRNKNGEFSLNIQMVCDAKLHIRNIIARWPGSVDNSTIFNNSPLCAQLQRGDFGNMVLLGDSSYPCSQHLLTPILNPKSPAEEAYNKAQCSTREPIERLFEILKHRFPRLQYGLGLKINKIPPIIVACAVLHNIAICRKDEIIEDMTVSDSVVKVANDQPILLNHEEGKDNFIVRDTLINTHFSILELFHLI